MPISSIYDEVAQIALDLLAEFGAPAVLLKRGASSYDPDTGKVVQAAPLSYSIQIFIKKGTETQRDKSAVVANRQEAIISPLSGGVLITNQDNVVFGGRTYKVVDPGDISPAGTPLVYDAVIEA